MHINANMISVIRRSHAQTFMDHAFNRENFEVNLLVLICWDLGEATFIRALCANIDWDAEPCLAVLLQVSRYDTYAQLPQGFIIPGWLRLGDCQWTHGLWLSVIGALISFISTIIPTRKMSTSFGRHLPEG